MKTLRVALSDAEIRRQAKVEDVGQLRDPAYRALRFRFGQDRTQGSWHVVVGGVWGKAANWPEMSAAAMIGALPSIISRRAIEPRASSTATTWKTCGEVLTWYLDRMQRDRNLSVDRKAGTASAINCQLIPRVGALALADTNRANLDRLMFWPMQEDYSVSYVRLVFSVLRVAFRRAMDLKLIESNPLADLKFNEFVEAKIEAKPGRLRVSHIPQLLEQLGQRLDVAPTDAMLPLMMLMHGSRVGETRKARWSNINLSRREWFIPANEAKTGKQHLLPLTDQACSLLRRYQAWQSKRSGTSVFLFPGADRAKPMTRDQATELFKALGGGEWTSHDLRKLARTAWTDLGVDYLIGELLLNHALKDLNAAYIHTSAEALKRDALERWHASLDEAGFVAIHSETYARQKHLPGQATASNGAASSQFAV